MSLINEESNKNTIPDEEKKLLHYLFWITSASFSFVVIYGLCNELASRSTNLYRVYFDWELNLPFLPWMIIPYRSLDLILIVVFFLLPKNKIKRFALHMMISLIPAGLIFYFFPAQAGFVRPNPESLGMWSSIFKLVYTLDKPHNLFPSLHVTYSYVGLMAIGDHHQSILAKTLCWIWFLFICASIIFTYQHHLFDLFTGLILGVLVYRYTVRKESAY